MNFLGTSTLKHSVIQGKAVSISLFVIFDDDQECHMRERRELHIECPAVANQSDACSKGSVAGHALVIY